MENPFAKFSQKDWLYVAGAVASIVALGVFIATSKGKTLFGSPTISDAVQSGTPGDVGSGGGVNYVNYNMGAADAPPISVGADLTPNPEGACCGGNTDCAGSSPLATGDTFGGLSQLLQYYQNTNPIYLQLQEVGMQRYAALFAQGETYAAGATPLAVPYN